ncbi:outer membrane protein assembly factor BamD [Bizionia argentinensis JUB59]|uniref:Outer membrane protein assembly factor BamD n=1 Tax=Bizionia argentinensis JUB59 TaxID=1046627 RepID=G2EGP4_9FLAO|nr:outer membrane protein assembly factor BamD [Bizionia argentinensis]EGV42427.1 outer membrane protein assembly factor BamD [Bizionia argentinensis JUB59]
MKKFLYIILTCTLLSSCSEYQKALKSVDTATKYNVGEKLYNAGKYAKANKLFEQILPAYRGKPQAEKVSYLNAKSYYEEKDWYLASHKFERFMDAYPNSEKLEEAAFLSAKSAYMLSPVFSKEQHETKHAIEKLQLFINLFPESEFLQEANGLVKELDLKLETKAFSIAKQFNTIAGFTRDFHAPMKAMDNFIIDFPGTVYREEALYIKFDSAFQLAVNSVYHKKEERLKDAKLYYNNFKKSSSNPIFIEKADKMNEVIDEELENYSTKS